MKPYHWILFDADDTLFHFDALLGLQRMFTKFNIEFSEQDYVTYHNSNKPLWVEYQNGLITPDQLQDRRFISWTEKFSMSARAINDAYMEEMANIYEPLPGALELLKNLHGKTKLGIITNGFTDIQLTRLERSGLKPYFDLLIISEQVGHAKPHLAIFDHALNRMNNPERHHVLMVGDNPEADIRGGLNAGFDTCWLNVNSQPAPEGVNPHYQVTSLQELDNLMRPLFI